MIKCSHTIQLSPITHRGEKRIKLVFEKDAQLIAKIKSIEGRRWSKTQNCWHLPYHKKSFTSIKKVFIDSELVYPKSQNLSDAQFPKKVLAKTPLEICYSSYQYKGEKKRKIIGQVIIAQQVKQEWIELYVPFDKTGWLNVLRHINGRKWDSEKLCWIVPNVKQSYWLLKEHIGLKNIQFDFTIKKDIPESYQFRYSFNKKHKQNKPKGFDLLNKDQKRPFFN